MIPVKKALKIVEGATHPLAVRTVGLAEACGRVLREDVVADGDLPPFDRSQMDGFAVHAADTLSLPAKLVVLGESTAGRGWHRKLPRGSSIRIMTGAPVPDGANAVVKVELTRVSVEDSVEYLHLLRPVAKGTAIVKRGSEIRSKKRVLHAGDILEANNISVAAAFGYSRIKVSDRPRVAILSTGTELVEIGKRPRRDQIRNSNSVMLAALVETVGAAPTIYPTAGDDLKDLTRSIRSAARNADVLITTGGVSVGDHDLTKDALAELGAEIFFERVRLKPGKPCVFANLGKTLVFSLPGNPVSAAVTFYMFVRKALLRLQAASDTSLTKGRAVLKSREKAASDRDSYLPADINIAGDGRLVATPVNWRGSSDLVAFAKAKALVHIPAGVEFEAGSIVDVYFIKGPLL